MFLKTFTKSLVVLAMLTGISASAAVVEGTDYVKLEKPIANAEGTVIKVFSYDCPFCYKYDKAVTKPVMKKVPEMKFVPYHLATKGVFGKYGSEILAVMIAKDQAAGIDLLDDNSNFKKVKFALYKAYHDKKEKWGNDASKPENVEAFYKTALEPVGMTKADVDAAVKDQKVQDILNKWGMDQNSDSYMVAKIQGVPAFVVDGKYLIYTKSIKGIDQMANTIKELHNLK
ncbi:disulfide isomerase [Campylobacter sputorum subsp. bubulus]|uniref:Thiol:disulfide interchange protein DsbA n=2 Tax=Campylobacter sputorum TaxID=206 RepID=A0A381DJC1_9BACT|nr:thiol:disulfide interchange protein DsbA/DsbL [Campylobacter sputorum]ASM35813.1 protein disulfide oxidoreductase [Campylobacter sputorum aubsp. sputorum RM3237]KAB0581526.1 thiol:disulfide interchange protein DsbA/DsbL [Campylobacter sputorum subsp. sputorum]QEL06003.1 protein disulfide oxidoreductase [Campylobacter sputorum subsp. sputorum]SUX09113.1 disulfide isomerase [Campylobacter sputorum subsp. bubulus]SUX10804.1 disulfide isomerase [Campylobacter sputorum subsp. sputorum]